MVSTNLFAATAYLLVYHGSRDPRPGQAVERLAQFVREHLETSLGSVSLRPGSGVAEVPDPPSRRPVLNPFERLPSAVCGGNPPAGEGWPRAIHPLPLVGTACLETGALPLHQQIVNFGQRAAAAGVTDIRIVPIFLLRGVHVLRDLPMEVQAAQPCLPGLSLTLTPPLGDHPGLRNLVQTRLQTTTAEAWLLLAHGSRRPEGNRTIHALAQALGGAVAYWAVPPHLDTQIIHLIQQGVQRLAILPYFLFTGSTTDAITQRAEELAERFPDLGIHLLPPLGPSPDLAQLVVDLAMGRGPVSSPQPTVSLKRMARRSADVGSVA
ncbi:MAG: CbiX/SirB N-terminal domain-containing protein [Leptolyngbya sp.]|nr:CbiX/SirB N-terminal domain-containing protein [Leptolyngbya sp.]